MKPFLNTGHRDADRPANDRLRQVARIRFLLAGYSGTSTRLIVKEAKTSLSAVSDEFGGKAGLWREVRRDCWRDLIRAIDIPGQTSDAGSALLELIERFLKQYFNGNKDLLVFCLSQPPDDLFESESQLLVDGDDEEFLDLVEEFCAQAVEFYAVPRRVSPLALAEIVRSLICGVVHDWHRLDKIGKPENKLSIEEALSPLAALLSDKSERKVDRDVYGTIRPRKTVAGAEERASRGKQFRPLATTS